MSDTVKEGYSITQAYHFYRKKNKKDKELVNRELYRKICKAFNKLLMEEAVNKPAGVRLPFSLGTLWVRKKKINWDHPPIDLNESKKAGKVIYHLNKHSDGHTARWWWTKRNSMVTNLIYYSFTPVRCNSDRVAKILLEGGHKKYFTKL